MTTKAITAGVEPATTSEEANDYRAVIAILNDDWRVIECRSGTQWITQRRLGGIERVTARWRSKSHCRSRADLIALVTRHAGEVLPDAMARLEELPAWIGEARTRKMKTHIIIGVAESVAGPGKFDTYCGGIMWMFGRSSPHEDMQRVLRCRGFAGRVDFVDEATGARRATMTITQENA